LIVRVEVTGTPFTGGLGGLKEHTGGIVTSGVMEAHDKVTPVTVCPPICAVGLE
jgi:hypothetical protein